LDEPTIGLHPRDNLRLLECLKELKGKGNSVVVVEHDEFTIRNADWIVDLGPGPGAKGGKVVAVGEPEKIKEDPASVTGLYLLQPLPPPLRGKRRPPPDDFLKINWGPAEQPKGYRCADTPAQAGGGSRRIRGREEHPGGGGSLQEVEVQALPKGDATRETQGDNGRGEPGEGFGGGSDPYRPLPPVHPGHLCGPPLRDKEGVLPYP